MALSASRLSLAIRTALGARAWVDPDGPELESFCDDIANAVIAEIVANGIVTVPGTGLTAPPSGGPVTGVAIGTIS